MDFSTILGGLSATAGGGILGVFGVIGKAWLEHKTRAQTFAHEIAMRNLDREEMELEHALVMKQTEAQTERDIAVAQQNRLATEAQVDGELMQASYSQDKASYGGGFVDAIRGLMRPTLTAYFAVLMALIVYQLFQINGAIFLQTGEAYQLLKDVINACIFLVTTAVTWWFGSRPVKRGV
ncbi:hypothetical protein [Thiomicrorhabdus indica]|uniref:hypothetical protein n=1 Tax=Thiomicrorhabdus indica TaxID=2267253 RepID=UPI002AA67DCC|nr:hypothetical protein [Thiomicrorhabdus indica]